MVENGCEYLYRRKQPLKSSTPESPIAVIQILNVIGCKVPEAVNFYRDAGNLSCIEVSSIYEHQ